MAELPQTRQVYTHSPELVGLRVRVKVACRAGCLADRPLPEQQKRAVHRPDDVVRVVHAPPWVRHSCCAVV